MDDNTAAAEILVPIFGMFFVFGLPVAAFIFFRVLAHRERMEMIRQGVVPPQRGSGPAPARPNAPSAQGSSPWCGSEARGGLSPDIALQKGIRLAFIGLAITIGLSFIGHHHLGPWLLGGLIPLFIGLSQVVIALLSGASLGSPRSYGPTPTAPPPYQGASPEPPTYDSSYTYRPDGTQELRRPTTPPERRQ